MIRGYRTGGVGLGSAIVTVNGAVLGLPRLTKHEGRHSPTGFEWGYLGSGPAELARAILISVFPNDPVVRHPSCYRQFKEDVIARIKDDTWFMPKEIVRSWYRDWQDARPETVVRILEGVRLDLVIAGYDDPALTAHYEQDHGIIDLEKVFSDCNHCKALWEAVKREMIIP